MAVAVGTIVVVLVVAVVGLVARSIVERDAG